MHRERNMSPRLITMDIVYRRLQTLTVWIVSLAILIPWQVERCGAQETGFCDQLVRSEGYSCEEHKIYTEDGYGILLHKLGSVQPSGTAARRGRSTLDLYEQAPSPGPDVDLKSTFNDVSQAADPAELMKSSPSYGSAADDLLEATRKPYQSASDYSRPYTEWLGGDSRNTPQHIPVALPFPNHEGPFDRQPADASPRPLSDLVPSNSAAPVPLPPAEPFTSRTSTPLASEDQNSTISEASSGDGPFSITSNVTSDPSVAPSPAQNQSQSTNDTNLPTPEPLLVNTHNFPDSGRSVLLLHPELLNGDSWFKSADTVGQSSTPLLPFVLADAGFDVWIGHERATYWTHDHLNMDSSFDEYWNWSWDEQARFDVPAMLGYIRDTAQSRVHLVGVSQSAVVATAVASQAGIAMLIKSLVLIGANVYSGNDSSPMLESWARLLTLTMNEPTFNSNFGPFNFTREFAVSNVSLWGPASAVSGPNCCINSEITLFDNGWDGTTSYKNVEHVQQAFFSNTFQHFDYGSTDRNMVAYGQDTPPAYTPEDIITDLPVMVVYGGRDVFSSPVGIQRLLSRMQREPLKVYLPSYAHFDLFFSSSRHLDIYNPIRSFLLRVLAAAPGNSAGPFQAVNIRGATMTTQAAPLAQMDFLEPTAPLAPVTPMAPATFPAQATPPA